MSVADQLFDSTRAVHYVKPRWRGRSHLVWFVLSLVAGPCLVLAADGATARVATTVYAVGLSALFGVSAVYHCGTWSAAASRVWQRWDHAMIFVLIAASATPVYLLGTPEPYGVIGVAATWAVTLAAIGVHLAWMHAPAALVGGFFIALGSSAGIAVPAIWMREGVAPALLIVAGGVLYATGAVLYGQRRPDPSPLVFGYHEVFHVFVCAGATCHFVAIAVFLR